MSSTYIRTYVGSAVNVSFNTFEKSNNITGSKVPYGTRAIFFNKLHYTTVLRTYVGT